MKENTGMYNPHFYIIRPIYENPIQIFLFFCQNRYYAIQILVTQHANHLGRVLVN